MSGLMLHAITLTTLVLIVLVAVFMEKHPLKALTITGGGIIAAFAQLDARSRFQEFKQVRDQLIDFGPDRRIFRSVAGSRCRRDTALTAARQLGYEVVCRNLFTAIGYRWYHLLPDRIVQDPRVLLTPAFWRATFFVPAYHSRYPLAADDRPLASHGHPTGSRSDCN